MIKIERGNYLLAQRLVIKTTCPSFSSIIAGIAKGDLWIDNLENPTFALVYSSPVGGYRIIGKIDENMYDKFFMFLEDSLFIQLKENGINEFEFAADNLEVENMLLGYFSKYEIVKDQELAFMNKPNDVNRQISSNSNFKYIKVDQECLMNPFSNKEFMLNRILAGWGNLDAYLESGIGFIAVDGDDIIGIILGSANYQNIMPVDIETINKYRKKGIATELTYVFLEFCQENSLTAYWNCVKSNTQSRRIAEKSGFQFIYSQDYYYFSF